MNQFFVPIAGKFISESNAKFSKCGDLYFVSKPNYDIFTTEELEGYRYLKPNERAHDVAVVIRTSNVSKMLKEYIKLPVNQYNLSDETIGKIKKGIDLRILDIKDVVEICDTLLEFDRVDVFELLYKHGNFPIDEYAAMSKFGYVKLLRYIEDPTNGQIVEKIKYNKELEKLICARQLKLSTQVTNNLVQIRLLSHEGFSVLYNVHTKLETLFSLGAIALTKQQIEKINQGIRKEYYPTIKEVYDCIKFNTNIKTVTTNPYTQTTSQGVLITTSPQASVENYTSGNVEEKLKKQAEKQSVEQQLQDKKEREEKQKQKEAEDQMDKLFAEAQKNIEMEK